MRHQPNHAVNQAGHLTVGGVDTLSLAKKYGTPLYLLDEDMIRDRMALYVQAMADFFPAGSRPLYASKALSFKEIYRIARDMGMGVDVVSAGELYTALAAGYPAEDIYLHGNAKTVADIRYAMESGVGHIVADGWEELERIDAIAAGLGRVQTVLLRVTPGIDPHTFKAVNTGVVDVKFGVPIPTGQALAVTEKALGLKNVVLDGFHCHIGSQVFDASPLRMGIDVMLTFLGEVRRVLGFTAPVLNLGGGFAVPYTEADPIPDYPKTLQATGEYFSQKCRELDLPAPAVLIEPGRSVVADAGVTLYTVQNVKSVPGGATYVAIDGGMTDNPRYALYQSQYTAVIADRAGAPADAAVTLAGRCCESGDLIGEGMAIQTPHAGDTVAVLVTGAYNYSMASNYNRIPRPPVVMLKGGQDRIVVRRETLEDLTSLDI